MCWREVERTRLCGSLVNALQDGAFGTEKEVTSAPVDREASQPGTGHKERGGDSPMDEEGCVERMC